MLPVRISTVVRNLVRNFGPKLNGLIRVRDGPVRIFSEKDLYY